VLSGIQAGTVYHVAQNHLGAAIVVPVSGFSNNSRLI
jgi:hypothetical protein